MIIENFVMLKRIHNAFNDRVVHVRDGMKSDGSKKRTNEKSGLPAQKPSHLKRSLSFNQLGLSVYGQKTFNFYD